MITYWTHLNEREKKMVGAAVIFSLVFVYYSLLYAPLSSGVREKTQLLQEKSSTLDWMKKAQKQKSTTLSKKTLDNSQLLTLLTSQLKDNKRLQFPFQVQQTSTGEIQLSFEKVPFNLFIEWLAQLNEHYYINIKQLNANKTDTPGITHLTLTLSAIA